MRGNVVQNEGLNIVGSEVISAEFAESLVKGEPVELNDVLLMENLTKLANPSVLPIGTGRGASFSPDGTYLAVAHDSSPFITIYKRNVDVFTKLANPSALPKSTGYGASFSPDGTYLAVAHATSPFITIYKRNGDVFTKLADPSALPKSTGYGASFSPDGTYLVVAHIISPFIAIYKAPLKPFASKIQNLAYLTDGASLGITKQAGSIGETKQVVKVVGW